MIQMLNVSKIYKNNVVALHDVTLSVGKGEFVFIVGPSGAGKSTLAKLIYREEVPSRGQLFVAGKNLVRMKDREVPFLRRGIGVVFQDFKLLPYRNVYENVAFAMEVIGASYRDIRKRVPAVLELVGLRDKMKALPSQLSGGEQQRVALARAIVNKPAIIIADEPTGNLDPDNSRGIMRLLAEINRMGATVLVATHNEAIVNSMRRRVVALDKGRVVSDQEKGVYAYEA